MSLTLVMLIAAGVIVGLAAWQTFVWITETKDKDRKYRASRAQADARGKLLLVAGGPYGGRGFRNLIRLPAHPNGDACLDINPRAIAGCPNAVLADVTRIPFADGAFGAAFASHLLEHLPDTHAAETALAELHRVADVVYIAYPYRQSLGGWLTRGHHLWVRQKGGTITLTQRGRSVNKVDRHRSFEVPVRKGAEIGG
jgi:hypothetical protein